MNNKYIKTIITISTLLLITGCGGGTPQDFTDNYNDTTVHNLPLMGGSNCNFVSSNDKNSTTFALEYLNSLRCLSGEHNFASNSELNSAAQAHSNYMDDKNIVGHSENDDSTYYTGSNPSQRVNYANYSNNFMGENVSAGQQNFQHSISGLFSAIYHRFGFLNMVADEIGIGKTGDKYTYDMGLTDTNLISQYRQNTPIEVVWPPANSTNIPPVFYEETPDPLPNYGVSGYPVSVEFNSAKVANDISVNQNNFTIKDSNGNYLNLAKFLNKNTDNNHELNKYQYAIFPEKRLDWGSKYFVHLEFSQGGNNYSNDWCFSTISLASYGAERVYKVTDTSDTVNLNIKSGTSYAIYLVPKDENDKFNSYNASGNVSSLSASFIDSNTLYVKAIGSVGNNITIHLNNNRDVKLIISNSDSATTPKQEICQ